MKIIILCSVAVGLSVFFWAGCKNDETAPTPTPTSGSATVNTLSVNNTVSGFSFSRAGSISFPNQAGVVPDMIALVQTGPSANDLSVYLARPDTLLPSFRLLREFGSIDSASQYFRALTELPDTTYLERALPLKSSQIWAVKTRESKFARILIRSTLAFVDTSGGTRTLYGQTTFDWAYQPDGTRIF